MNNHHVMWDHTRDQRPIITKGYVIAAAVIRVCGKMTVEKVATMLEPCYYPFKINFIMMTKKD